MATARAATADPAPISHNLLGQRLGAKGRGTRARILAATERLLETREDAGISLSAVAREASLSLSTLYLYFCDQTELLLAVLEPIMASAEEAYVAHLRERWPDAALGPHALAFVESLHGFWERHTRILHLRNSLADAQDARMLDHRIRVSHPLVELIVRQMDRDPAMGDPAAVSMATVLLTGIERVATVTTDFVQYRRPGNLPAGHVHNMLQAAARLLEFGIRDERARAGAGR